MNKKKAAIISSISIGAIALSCLIGLVITGANIGWGPFSFIYWPREAERVKREYPYAEYQEGIHFYGASNFRLWKEMTSELKEYKVSNGGFGGSTDELMSHYAEELLYPYHPKIVFFQTASNDFASIGGSDEYKLSTSLTRKKQMLASFHERMPNAKFVLMSGLLIPGRSQFTDITIQLNQAMDEYAKSVDYLYFVCANDLTYDDGKYRTDLFINDGIHLTHEGQLLWCDHYIRPQIEELIQAYPELESVKRK